MTLSPEPNLLSVVFDEQSVSYVSPENDRERKLVANDMLIDAYFVPIEYQEESQFHLKIGLQSGKFVLDFTDKDEKITQFIFSFSPYVKLLREYEQICQAYKHAVLHDNASSIETIDMARRGLHNQAADLISERLQDKIRTNYQACRLLFTVMTFLFKV